TLGTRADKADQGIAQNTADIKQTNTNLATTNQNVQTLGTRADKADQGIAQNTADIKRTVKYTDDLHNTVNLNAKLTGITNGYISTTSQDAVNGSQLYQSNLNAKNYTDSQVQNLSNSFSQRFNQLDKKVNSGVASALAVASLGQPIREGSTAIGIATGSWNNSTNIAIGASGITSESTLFGRPVNYIWKAGATSDFKGNSGGGASVMVDF
ncbi:hypothetical protein I2F30_13070, partial [Acinetobacter sp. SCC474]|nr:hypothetical protein [Acinetobacter pollinis]